MAKKATLSKGSSAGAEVYLPVNHARNGVIPAFEDVHREQHSILRAEVYNHPLELLFCPILNAIRFRCILQLANPWRRTKGDFTGHVALSLMGDIAFRVSDNGLFPETLELGRNIPSEGEGILSSPTYFHLLYQVQISRYTKWKTSGPNKIKLLQAGADISSLVGNADRPAIWYGNTVNSFLSCAQRLAQTAGDIHLLCSSDEQGLKLILRRELYRLATDKKVDIRTLPVLWGFIEDQNPSVFRDFLKIIQVLQAWVEGETDLHSLPFLWK